MEQLQQQPDAQCIALHRPELREANPVRPRPTFAQSLW